MQQGRVQVDADWNEQQAIHQHRIETEAAELIGRCGTPEHQPGFEITINNQDLVIGNGRFYVDGILCENEIDVPYTQQPDWPNPPAIADLLSDADLGIVYLDVWQRHLTALDDPQIREVALGGPDTATRLKTLWQVKVLPIKLQAPQAIDEITCHSSISEWDQLIASSTGTLTAQTKTASDLNNPCLVPPDAGYQRLENQLYRVEIHQGGDTSDSSASVSFKWSRDNGAVVTTVADINGNSLTVNDLGPDQTLGFAPGQWVELLDDITELTGTPGQFVRIANIVETGQAIIVIDPVSVSASTSLQDAIDLDRHPKLRRWNQTGIAATNTGVAVTTTGLIDLEGGIQVQFSEGTYRTGDYWLIPARTATGQIEWPTTEGQNPVSAPLSPLGIRHHYCRLALIQPSDLDVGNVQYDCRIFFPKLTQSAIHVVKINWPNDNLFPGFLSGIPELLIDLDAQPAEGTVDSATLIVSAESPINSTAPYIYFILDGETSVIAKTIRWVANTRNVSALRRLMANNEVETLRVRVTLKGHAIWSELDNKRAYLDGQTFGQSDEGTLNFAGKRRTDLIFPSGFAGTKASDFESWFYIGSVQVRILQIENIKFMTVDSAGGISTIRELSQSELQSILSSGAFLSEPLEFFEGAPAMIEITFNLPIAAAETRSNIRVSHHNSDTLLPSSTSLSNSNRTLLYEADFEESTTFRLTVFGDDDNSIDAIALKAANNTVRLDGNYSGSEGGNFVLFFEANIL